MFANRNDFMRAHRAFRAAFGSTFTSATRGPEFDMLAYVDRSPGIETEEQFLAADSTEIPKHNGLLHRQAEKLFKFTYRSHAYAAARSWKREDARIDDMGWWATRGASLARHMAITQRRTLIRYLVNGFNGSLLNSDVTTWDGQFLFDSDHVGGSGSTWSNTHALALSPTNFDTVYASLRSAPTPEGDPLFAGSANDLQVVLLVGPKLQATAESIVKATINGGEVNPRSGRAEIVVLHDLASTDPEFASADDYWFLMAKTPDAEMRPLTFKLLDDTEITLLTDPTDECVYEYDMYEAKVRAHFGFGYRAPWVIQGSAV